MAKLFRVKIVEYRLADGSYRVDGKRVTAKTPGAVKSVRESTKWYGVTPDGNRVPLSESKERSRHMLNVLCGKVEMEGVGLANPFTEHLDRPLLDHLEDFRRYLAGKGNSAEHVAKTFSQCKAVLDGIGATAFADLQPSAVVGLLADLRSHAPERSELTQESYSKAEMVKVLGIHPGSVARMLKRAGLDGQGNGKARRYSQDVVRTLQDTVCQAPGVTTSNHYLTAIKGFTRWLVKDGRTPADPLASLTRQHPDADLRHQRRALPEDTFSRFVDATAEGKPFRGLTGADRLVIYTLAANTGFRAELQSLRPSSFHLKGDRPAVTVEAGYSKHRRKDVQPLRPDVAEMIRQYIGQRKAPTTAPLWPGTWADVGAEMVRHDLEAAGIPYQDDNGRYFDFHAVRGQFISSLAAAGVHPKVAQQLARHSDINLTMRNFTHLDVLNVAGALDKLPPLAGPSKPDRAERKAQ